MKRLVIALAVLLLQCAPNANVLSIDKFFAVEAGCKLPDSVIDAPNFPGGTLDVSIFAPEFYVGVVVKQERTTQKPVLIGTTELDQADRDQPTITSITFAYRLLRNGKDATPAALKGKKFTTPMVLPLDSDGLAYGALNIITPAAADALSSSLDVAETLVEGYDMFVAIEFAGRMSRSANPISTGPLEFPIRVINRTPGTCNRPQRSVGACTFTGMGGFQTMPTPLAQLTCCDPLTTPIVGCDYTKP